MPQKTCPICSTSNQPSAAICWNCGTTLRDTPTQQPIQAPSQQTNLAYDFRHGETDLYEPELNSVARQYSLVMGLILVFLVAAAATVTLIPTALSATAAMFETADTATPSPWPTSNRPTVTPAPPTTSPTLTLTPTATLTPTPTPEPCYQEVQAGDVLYAVVARCGHQSFDVLPIVVETNSLRDANSISQGQRLEIPWPTPTGDTNLIEPTDNPGEESAANDADISDPFSENFDALFVPTPTLQPGIQFHTVVEGENMIAIAVQYGANVEILSQLNPEIVFSQCDFGTDFGGPRCSVSLNQGQLVRVPAPTPTPTIPPTASGSETPRPTITATYNVPSVQSPEDRSLFQSTELITLRWSPTGTLSERQAYLIRVEDQTAGVVYTASTIETSFVIPSAWQGVGERHDYAWTISVINEDDRGNPIFTSETITFVWEGS